MKQTLSILQNSSYTYINPLEYISTLTTDPLWYIDSRLQTLLKKYVLTNTSTEENWKDTRLEIVKMFMELIDKKKLLLGNREEYFNDDDRWHPETYKRFHNKSLSSENNIDTVVIHHSSTPPETTYEAINALHLLRLYIPVFLSEDFKNDGKYQPISSGHFFEKKQTFIGYHYLIWPDGKVIQTLKDEYVGFHAGDYKTNCRSIGICVIDDLNDHHPDSRTLKNIQGIIKKYRPKYIIGHGEVIRGNGEKLETDCPGKTFYGNRGWKKELIDLS